MSGCGGWEGIVLVRSRLVLVVEGKGDEHEAMGKGAGRLYSRTCDSETIVLLQLQCTSDTWSMSGWSLS